MTESFEAPKTPEHKMYENAINDYPDFLIDLQTAQNLEDLIDTLLGFTYVDGGSDNEHIFFEVIESDGEATEVTPFETEKYVTTLREFIRDSTVTAEKVDGKILHGDLNRAVRRILGIL